MVYVWCVSNKEKYATKRKSKEIINIYHTDVLQPKKKNKQTTTERMKKGIIKHETN